MRISRDVVLQMNDSGRDIAVISEAPGVVGEKLTLALVSSAGQVELHVMVTESRPTVIEGALRHQMRLEILSGPSAAGEQTK